MCVSVYDGRAEALKQYGMAWEREVARNWLERGWLSALTWIITSKRKKIY